MAPADDEPTGRSSDGGSAGSSGADSRAGSGAEPANTMTKRANRSRLAFWVYLHANRWVVAAALLLVVFVTLVVAGTIDPLPLRNAMQGQDPIETLFQAMLTAIITGVTLVVTINQLVLSQELGPLGDQRDRMEGAMSFREDVEDLLDLPVTAATPEVFLRQLVGSAGERAERLTNVSTGDPEIDDRLGTYAEELRANADAVSDRLEDRQFGTFEVLSAALDFNYSWKIYEGRRIGNRYADDLPDGVRDQLEELVDTLRLFGPAREHIKTLYFQWELIDLSRAMLFSAVPALLVSVGSILFLDNPGTILGQTFGVDNLLLVTALAVTIAVAPFAILVSFVLRISTVAKRTLSIGPFILREEGRSADDEWGTEVDSSEE